MVVWSHKTDKKHFRPLDIMGVKREELLPYSGCLNCAGVKESCTMDFQVCTAENMTDMAIIRSTSQLDLFEQLSL